MSTLRQGKYSAKNFDEIFLFIFCSKRLFSINNNSILWQNIDPCSEEPTLDITFGVDNPTYVAMKDMGEHKEEDLYEIISIAEDTTDQEDTKDDGSPAESLSNVNIELVEEGLARIAHIAHITTGRDKKETFDAEEAANEKPETAAGDNEQAMDEKDYNVVQGKSPLLQ